MIPTIFKEIKDNVEQRSQAKKTLESIIPFSDKKKPLECFNSQYNATNNSVRLLDEGAILWGDDMTIRMWIAKGTVNKFYESLDDDFVGYITLGHLDLTKFPLLLGTWTKKDLTIIELEGGRKALNCTPHLNKSLSIVNDLLSQEIPLSVSVEMSTHMNEALSDALCAEVVDEIFIQGFSIVGDPANVSSSDVKFGGKNVTFKELLEKFSTNEVEETEKLENEKVEDIQEEKVEEKIEETEELENEKVEETEELENDSDVDETLEKFSALLEKMQGTIDGLTTENNDLRQQLADSKKEKKDFSDEVIEKFTNLMNSQVKTVEKFDQNDSFGTKNL